MQLFGGQDMVSPIKKMLIKHPKMLLSINQKSIKNTKVLIIPGNQISLKRAQAMMSFYS